MNRTAEIPPLPDIRQGTLHGRPRRLVRALLLLVAKLLIGLKVEGLHHVPDNGPVLVVTNHRHNADPVLLAIAFPRALYFMAKSELFGNRYLGTLIRFAGAFPVERQTADRKAIRYAGRVLAQGEAVAMFPEGTRSLTGRLGVGQPGAGLIALMSKAPILPVAIAGTETLPGNGLASSPPSGRMRGATIRFGAPFLLPATSSTGRVTSQEATDAMMAAVAALLPDVREDG